MDNDNEQKANGVILIHCCHISSTSGSCLKLIIRQWIYYFTSLLEKSLKCIQVALFLNSCVQLILCLKNKRNRSANTRPVGQLNGSCVCRSPGPGLMNPSVGLGKMEECLGRRGSAMWANAIARIFLWKYYKS